MEICGVVIIMVIIFGAAKIWDRKYFIVILAGAVLCFAAAVINKTGSSETNIDHLKKSNVGEGRKIKELVAKVGNEEGKAEEVGIDVSVPEREYSKEECEKILKDESALLTERILGENKSADRIEYDINLPSAGNNPAVSIDWYSSDNEILNWEGKIGDEVPKNGTQITLKAVLTLQTEELIYEEKLKVYPKVSDGSLQEKLVNEIEEENKNSVEENYYLPDSVDGEKVVWYEASEESYGYVAALLLVAGILLNISKKQKEDEKKKQRTQRLKKDYPELVSRLILMLYSGSSLRNAFYSIGNNYRKRKKEGEGFKRNEAFEETVILCHEIENGITEIDAYENLAKRCALPAYRSLCVALIQNQKRGGGHIIENLEQEVINAFEEKKRQARIASDAASMKLLLPLVLMLAIVFALMMIPAFLSL